MIQRVRCIDETLTFISRASLFGTIEKVNHLVGDADAIGISGGMRHACLCLACRVRTAVRGRLR